MSSKKGKKKPAAKKPAALDVSELEEGEIRDTSISEPASKSSAATAAPAGKRAKSATKPSKPSPTELKQGWEFVESPGSADNVSDSPSKPRRELEEGEIVDDDEWIVQALKEASTESKQQQVAAAGMWL